MATAAMDLLNDVDNTATDDDGGCEAARSGDITQIIRSDGDFMPAVGEWLEKAGFTSLGFNYSVATVLGCQSSGKSTLLNSLFGTKFPVMNAKIGRQQTTKGAWLSTSRLLSVPIAIIDAEGTDSRERGEDRMTFEHRSALFSLALADVVVVNMWYHDLGRYTASNYGLLKTVLAVNLGLFQQEKNCPKTVMLFVIRDYSESQTPIDTLHRMIHADIASIWKEIKKPDHLVSSTADDFFEFRLVGIPSMFVDPQGFQDGLEKLAKRWEAEFLPAKYSRKIPADGFSFYMQSVWETILNQSELDIPSQKEMLASYRCEEIKNAVLAQFALPIQEKLNLSNSGQLSDFSSWARDILSRAIETYTVPASRYQEGVFLKKRDQLIDCLCAELQRVVDAHLNHVRRKIYDEELASLRRLFPQIDNSDEDGEAAEREIWKSFKRTCDSWRLNALHRFNKIADDINTDALSDIVITEMLTYDDNMSTVENDSGIINGEGLGLINEKSESNFRSQSNFRFASNFRNPNSYRCASDRRSQSNFRCASDRRSQSNFRPTPNFRFAESGINPVHAASYVRPTTRRFQTEQPREALVESLDSAIEREKERQMRSFTEVLGRSIIKLFGDIEVLIADPTVDATIFWRDVKSLCISTKACIQEKYWLCWKGFNESPALLTLSSDDYNNDDLPEEEVNDFLTDDKENEDFLSDIDWDIRCSTEVLHQARVKLEYIAEWLHTYIIQRFQVLFSADKQGVPRQWTTVGPEKIKSIFIEARDAALDAADVLTVMMLNEIDFLPEDHHMDKRWSQPIVNELKKATIIQRSVKSMQRSCQEAQILQAAAGRHTYIPIWFYLALLALGWNELYIVISSPFTMILLLVVGVIGGLTYFTGHTLLPVVLGKQVLSAMATILMPILLMFQENSLPLGATSPSGATSSPVRRVKPNVPPEEQNLKQTQ